MQAAAARDRAIRVMSPPKSSNEVRAAVRTGKIIKERRSIVKENGLLHVLKDLSTHSEYVSSYTATHVPEAILTEILARLPLRSIFKFKSVCRTWKSALESVYFRHLFVSLHQNTSSSWSLLFPRRELIDFHGCQTWDLPKSLGSYMQNIQINFNLGYVHTSNGLVSVNGYNGVSFVGNPLLQQWVKIRPPPYPLRTSLSGLVTRVDEDGVVLSFKVVRTSATPSRDGSSTSVCFCVYSSETGTWTCKYIHCPHFFRWIEHSMTLQGMLYLSTSCYDSVPLGALIAYDIYGESNICRVIPLPDHNLNHNQDFKRALTTSTGFVMYINTLANNVLKVWRLLNNDDDSAWQVVWEICLPFIPIYDDISYYVPLAMHPFDHNIVYLWSQQNRYVVSCNLQTQNFNILNDLSVYGDLPNCNVNQSTSERLIDEIFGPYRDGKNGIFVTLFQYVLPRWLGSMPCPPQVKIVDTTSLLSYLTTKAG